MHGYRYTAQEAKVADLAKTLGFTQVSASHEVSPLIKFVSRGDTTVVDAYVSPILRRYVDQVGSDLDAANTALRLMFMHSNGGLADAHFFQGKDIQIGRAPRRERVRQNDEVLVLYVTLQTKTYNKK